jgi:hypothetical protein
MREGRSEYQVYASNPGTYRNQSRSESKEDAT